MANRYSVYNAKDDMPVAIYATSRECARAMKIKRGSFYTYIYRMQAGKVRTRKWVICRDEIDAECA